MPTKPAAAATTEKQPRQTRRYNLTASQRAFVTDRMHATFVDATQKNISAMEKLAADAASPIPTDVANNMIANMRRELEQANAIYVQLTEGTLGGGSDTDTE